MKKFLNILFIMFSLLLFTQKVSAQNIPKGDYSVEEIFHLNIFVVDQAGNKLKEIYLCYIGEGCNKMTLQSDGSYKRDTNYNFEIQNEEYKDNTSTKKVNIYIKAVGYIASQSYSIEEVTTSKYTLNGKKVTDEFTRSFTGLSKVTLIKKDSTQKCSAINGKGNMIGDEVKCGTESFYIMGQDGDNYKLLSKYNLYVGYNQYNSFLDKAIDKYIVTIYTKRDSSGKITSQETSYNTNDVEDLIKKNEDAGNYKNYSNSREIYDYEEYIDKYTYINVTGISYKLRKTDSDGNTYYESYTENLSSVAPTVIYTYKNMYNEETESMETEYVYDNEELENIIKTVKNKSDFYTYWLNYSREGDSVYQYIYNNYQGIRFTNYISEEDELYGKQNEIAIGAHGDAKGKPEAYEYGNVPVIAYTKDEDDVEYSGGYYDISGENYYFDGYILDYADYLDSEGFNTGTVRMPNLTDINTLVKDLSGSELPLETWYNEWWTNGEVIYDAIHVSGYSVLGSIKDHLSGNYNWIYSTTYLLNTYSDERQEELRWGKEYAYFIDTLGELCNTYTCTSYVGAGIRPIVYMPVETYTVDTKTDGHGQITYNIVNGAVVFTITPDEGYVLGVALVTDSEGNKLEFTNNTFTMPNDDVTIEATFLKVENPVTSSSSKIIILCSITILLATFILTSRRKLHI